MSGRDLILRNATEADHLPLVRVVDDWWGGRATRHRLPRLWFRHFAGTSFVVEAPDGGRVGFVIGFVSPDRPTEAYLHLLGVAPGRRRRGLGRWLLDAFTSNAASRGADRIETTAWPGDPIAIAFLRGVGFRVDDSPGTQRLYGVPSWTDWDDDRDDQVVLTREI